MKRSENHYGRRWSAEVVAEARRIHRCPEGYEGPCWGPTLNDLHTAEGTVEATK